MDKKMDEKCKEMCKGKEDYICLTCRNFGSTESGWDCRMFSITDKNKVANKNTCDDYERKKENEE